MTNDLNSDFAEEQAGVVARCDACGGIFRNVPWIQGMTCPRCSSVDFKPVAIIHGALDYTLADRSGGFTAEDVRVGTLAKWVGLITPAQCNQALAMMRSRASGGQACPPIGNILMEQKWANETEVAALIHGAYHKTATPDDEEFGRLALQNGFLTRDQVADIEKWQQEFERRKRDVPAAALLYYEKRYLKENQIVALLRAQQLRSHGPLHAVWAASEESRRRQSVASTLMGKGQAKNARLRLLGVAVLFLVAIFVWYHSYYALPNEQIDYMCKSCGAIYPARVVRKFPTKCRKCGKREAYYCVQCKNCGTIYTRANMFSSEYCPKCNSGFFGRVRYDAAGQPIERKGRDEKPPGIGE